MDSSVPPGTKCQQCFGEITGFMVVASPKPFEGYLKTTAEERAAERDAACVNVDEDEDDEDDEFANPPPKRKNNKDGKGGGVKKRKRDGDI